MYTTKQRIEILQLIFNELRSTNSRIEKEEIINAIPQELIDDFMAVLEVLDNRVVFGYRIENLHMDIISTYHKVPDEVTIRQLIDICREPRKIGDLSEANVIKTLNLVGEYIDFLQPIIDKTLKLGIGKSILITDIKAPMLAKRLGDYMPRNDCFVTEKLDGNRCIAWYEDNKWNFISRNGRRMNVDFDMSSFSTEFVYDGEILSGQQTYESVERTADFFAHIIRGNKSNTFSQTSGLINRKYDTNKDLCYNIFDIQANMSYNKRRHILETFNDISVKTNVRIVPVLSVVEFKDQIAAYDKCIEMLENITSNGGEGLMLNECDMLYEHKRTRSLLKFKKVQSMDMRVESIYLGTGKYENVVGGINCIAEDLGGITYACSVGSGLSDAQRFAWALHPQTIIGKIVEIEYFEITQDKAAKGSKFYSLRFPRLKQIRGDKNETSTQ